MIFSCVELWAGDTYSRTCRPSSCRIVCSTAQAESRVPHMLRSGSMPWYDAVRCCSMLAFHANLKKSF
jgi:hypothetical protein